MSSKHGSIKEASETVLKKIKENTLDYKLPEQIEAINFAECKEKLEPLLKDYTKKIRNKILGLVYSKLKLKKETVFQTYLNKLKKKKKKKQLFFDSPVTNL